MDSNIKILAIPDNTVGAGHDFIFDVAAYFIAPAGEILKFSVEDGPPEIMIDPMTGILQGFAPNIEVNMTYTLQIIATTFNSTDKVVNPMQLTVVGTLLLQSPDASAFLGMEPFNFWNAARDLEIALLVQYLINEHFVYIMAFDAEDPPDNLGKALITREAKTGWTIIHYEKCLIVAPGEMAFAESGNRTRLLLSVEEMFQSDLPSRNWSSIGLYGSDVENVGRAWVVAKRLNLPVVTEAPTDAAQYNLANIERLDVLSAQGWVVPTHER